MRTLKLFGMLLLLGALCAGCQSSGNDKDAIQKAIQTHLAGRSNLNPAAFDTEVQKVDIQGEEAKADVAFKVKGGPGVMQLTYNLKKSGGNWAVVESNPIGSNFTHPSLDPNAPPPADGGAGVHGDIMDSMRERMGTTPK